MKMNIASLHDLPFDFCCFMSLTWVTKVLVLQLIVLPRANTSSEVFILHYSGPFMSAFQCCYSFGLILKSAMKLITVVNQKQDCPIFTRVYLPLLEHEKCTLYKELRPRFKMYQF